MNIDMEILSFILSVIVCITISCVGVRSAVKEYKKLKSGNPENCGQYKGGLILNIFGYLALAFGVACTVKGLLTTIF